MDGRNTVFQPPGVDNANAAGDSVVQAQQLPVANAGGNTLPPPPQALAAPLQQNVNGQTTQAQVNVQPQNGQPPQASNGTINVTISNPSTTGRSRC